jgi:transketolase
VTRLADIFSRRPPIATDATPLAQARQPERRQRMVEALRLTALRNWADAHPDAIRYEGNGKAPVAGAAPPAFAMADVVTTLWTRALRIDAADSSWPDRDRIIVATRQDARLMRAVLELSGLDPADLSHGLPGIEAVIGQAGEALSFAVGCVLSERMLAARFGKSLVDHRAWLFATPADITGGIGYEAASLAGELRLSKLAILVEEPAHPTPDETPAAELLERFASWGWATKRIAGHDAAAIASALSFTLRARKPVLLVCKTSTPPAPRADRTVSEDVAEAWRGAGARATAARRGWLKRLARHALAGDFERVLNGRLPDGWRDAARINRSMLVVEGAALSGPEASRRVIEALGTAVPEMIRASLGAAGRPAGLAPLGHEPVENGDFARRHIQFGSRQVSMAVTLAGVVGHGGLIPAGGLAMSCGHTLFPAIRTVGRHRRRIVFTLLEEAAETASADYLATFRALPELLVFRPAGAVETSECWELALHKEDGPSVLVQTPQPVPPWRTDTAENSSARGAYLTASEEGPRAATLIASGAEVEPALAAQAALAQAGITVAVVSMPSWSLFAAQDEAYQTQTLGDAPRIGVEPGTGFGWERWLGPSGHFVSSDVILPGQAHSAQTVETLTEALIVAVKKKL